MSPASHDSGEKDSGSLGSITVVVQATFSFTSCASETLTAKSSAMGIAFIY